MTFQRFSDFNQHNCIFLGQKHSRYLSGYTFCYIFFSLSFFSSSSYYLSMDKHHLNIYNENWEQQKSNEMWTHSKELKSWMLPFPLIPYGYTTVSVCVGECGKMSWKCCVFFQASSISATWLWIRNGFVFNIDYSFNTNAIKHRKITRERESEVEREKKNVQTKSRTPMLE